MLVAGMMIISLNQRESLGFVVSCFNHVLFPILWNVCWVDHTTRLDLVGGLEHEFYDFPSIGNNDPNWLSYFSEEWLNHQPVIFMPCWWYLGEGAFDPSGLPMLPEDPMHQLLRGWLTTDCSLARQPKEAKMQHGRSGLTHRINLPCLSSKSSGDT